MDSSNSTHLLLSHGNIQVSPNEVTALNQQGMTEFRDPSVDVQSNIPGYQVLMTGYATHIYSSELKRNEIEYLNGAMRALRSMPRPMNALALKGSVDTYRKENNYFRLDYRVFSGQVEVFNIEPVDRLQKERDSQEKIALYKVKKNSNGTWQLAGKTSKVDTKLAAVNGQSNNLAKATWLMGAHLEFEFGNELREYTLFHNPSVGGAGDTWESVQDKFGFTTDVTKEFAKVLGATQKADNETTWIAHSQGGIIFAEGVRYLLNGKSSWALNKLNLNGIRNPEKGELLNKQSVIFHGNANNNMRSKPLFKRAGVKIVGVRAHDYDFVTNIIGTNTLNPRKLLGSLVYGGHVFRGSIAQSPHTLAQTQQNWEHNMEHGPGNGRNGLQQTCHKTGTAIKNTVNAIKNYLP